MVLHSNILGEGKTFLILHGFLGMSDNWKTLGRKFSENQYQVHLIDQRNHGRSFHSEVFDYDVLADDLKNYCDTHNVKDAILLGHSMGGKTAMLFAVKYPDYVSRLLIADISPRFYPTHHQTILEGLSAFNFDELKTRGEADKQLENYVPDFGTRQFLLKNLYWQEKGKLGLRVNLQALKDNVTEIGEAFPTHLKYEGDTLFLRGDKSEYIMPNDESLIHTHFPQAKIVTIPKAGHWLHAENPLAFYDAVMAFVN